MRILMIAMVVVGCRALKTLLWNRYVIALQPGGNTKEIYNENSDYDLPKYINVQFNNCLPFLHHVGLAGFCFLGTVNNQRATLGGMRDGLSFTEYLPCRDELYYGQVCCSHIRFPSTCQDDNTHSTINIFLKGDPNRGWFDKEQFIIEEGSLEKSDIFEGT